MKLSPASPELTAYLLGELTPTERADVEAALAAAPELRAELDSLRTTSEQLTREFAAEPALELSPDQRALLLDLARHPAVDASVHPSQLSQRPRSMFTVWRDELVAWRAQWIWASAALCGLVMTLSLWRLQPPAQTDFDELRYQRRLSTANEAAQNPMIISAPPSQTPAVAPVAQSLEPKPADAPVDNLAASVNSFPQVALGANPTVGKSESVLLERSASTTALGQRSRVESTLKLSEATEFFTKHPEIARRYGFLADAGGTTAGSGIASSEWEQLKRQGDLVELRAALTESPAYLQYPAESRGLALHFGETKDPLVAGLAREAGTESYSAIADNTFKEVLNAPLSTFGLDVDTASYANVRRFLRDGFRPPPDAVRLEELINYFHYNYPTPRGDEPFGVAIEIADCPWKEGHQLVRVGLQAKTIERRDRPQANLVFLLDVSGSMEPENKLPLVKRSLRLLLERLTGRDSVGIVTYAGESRVALEPTLVSTEGRARINQVIESLRAGSGTAGAAGIVDAYRLATNRLDHGSVNRVILCTDGDFNIGITDPAELQRLIENQAKSGVFLSVLGYGLGNLKDSTMELLADKGNGNYAYVDSFTEARKVLSEQLEGTLVTVAKDVKVQVEFNPARVKSYRLLGYENRVLRDRDFTDDTKDAGDVGAGHQVTVLYELEPAGPQLAGTDPLRYQGLPANDGTIKQRLKPGFTEELLNLKLRYKAPDGNRSRLIETPVKDVRRDPTQASSDFKFAAAVAGYGMLLRDSPYKGDLSWEQVLRLAEQGLGGDAEGYRSEFVDLVRRAQQLNGGR